MNPLVLFKPDEKIKWICAFEPDKEIIITMFLTEKYDDVRIFNIKEIEQVNAWKNEMLAQEWIEIENDFENDLIFKIITNKNIYSRSISLDEAEIKKIYDTYKIDEDLFTA